MTQQRNTVIVWLCGEPPHSECPGWLTVCPFNTRHNTSKTVRTTKKKAMRVNQSAPSAWARTKTENGTRKRTKETIQNMFQQDSHILTEMEILFMPSTQLRRTQPSIPRSTDEQAAVPLYLTRSTPFCTATCCNRHTCAPLPHQSTVTHKVTMNRG